MKLIRKIELLLVVLLPIVSLFVLPHVGHAALGLTDQDCPRALGIRCTETTLASLIRNITSIILGVAGLIAVLFIIIGGFQYIFSGANEELAETGKKTLQNAIIGVVIIILSFVIVNVVGNLLSR